MTRYCTASWYPRSATSPTTTRRSQPSADCLNRGDNDVPSVCKIDNGWKQIWRGSAFAVDATEPTWRNRNDHNSSHKVYYVKLHVCPDGSLGMPAPHGYKPSPLCAIVRALDDILKTTAVFPPFHFPVAEPPRHRAGRQSWLVQPVRRPGWTIPGRGLWQRSPAQRPDARTDRPDRGVHAGAQLCQQQYRCL